MFEALVGASVLASDAIALFFLRFWQQTRDPLTFFEVITAMAFAVFAVNRILLSALDDQSEAQTAVYLARALTFALIALAIADKNWPGMIERLRHPSQRLASARAGRRRRGERP